MQQLDTVLPTFAALDVDISADPGHEMTTRATARRHVAKSEDESTIVGLHSDMPITAQPPGSVGGIAPCRPLVSREHH